MTHPTGADLVKRGMCRGADHYVGLLGRRRRTPLCTCQESGPLKTPICVAMNSMITIHLTVFIIYSSIFWGYKFDHSEVS
jgi:hypothetical protein